jgi:heavy metal sensor kinase
MTLAGRLSAFFLGALALVLLGFSAALYLLAQRHLHRQAHERLQSALNTLAAAAEVTNDGVEWEPHQRPLALGRGAESVSWAVCDQRGRALDGAPPDFLLTAGELPARIHDAEGRPWEVAERRLMAPRGEGGKYAIEDGKYPLLVVRAAVPLAPVQAALARLTLLLGGLSAGLWLLAALAGRRLCRRALAPVTRMAAAARAMDAQAPPGRLPLAGTADELDDLARAFNDLLGRLRESFERQARFTGDASHQLRTPLAGLLGQVEVALRRPRDAEEYREVLGRVRAEALNLQKLVEMLLFLARADAEARLAALERLDLGVWLERHLEGWAGHARAGDLHLDVAAGAWVVEAQGPLLGQLVDNLIENACKYSAPGTPITLRVGGEARAVILEVEDEGCGIAAEDLPHIFEPFYRSESARRRVGGVGLGLAVARRIAGTFGATLEVRSEAGRGACFRVRFPSVAREVAVPFFFPTPSQP